MNDMTQTHLDTRTIALDDSERQRCEVWTRVMGYHRPVCIIQHRQERRIS